MERLLRNVMEFSAIRMRRLSRTAQRVGYRREGLLRQYQYVGPARRDMYIYSLLRGVSG